MLNTLLTYDMEQNSFTNTTIPFDPFTLSSLVYVPVGHKGILISLGGMSVSDGSFNGSTNTTRNVRFTPSQHLFPYGQLINSANLLSARHGLHQHLRHRQKSLVPPTRLRVYPARPILVLHGGCSRRRQFLVQHHHPRRAQLEQPRSLRRYIRAVATGVRVLSGRQCHRPGPAIRPHLPFAEQ